VNRTDCTGKEPIQGKAGSDLLPHPRMSPDHLTGIGIRRIILYDETSMLTGEKGRLRGLAAASWEPRLRGAEAAPGRLETLRKG
jgi:hypothetical protein